MRRSVITAYLFDEDFLAELRQKCDLETVASRYMQLKRAGASLTGLCPFHNEKTPSFHINAQKGLFYCFGCHAGGDVVSFVMKIDNLSYTEAVAQLAESVGMELPKRDGYDSANSEMRRVILDMNRTAARFYYETLRSPQGKAGLEYFHKRALTDKTITRFGLGFSPDSWDSLLNHLLASGYKPDDIKASGLVSVTDKNMFDRFRNRVMFPIIDQRNNVIGFGGRTMGTDPAKYLNTSETLVFKKGFNLYALNIAKSSQEKGLILCEGYMDVIALHQAGFSNAVATLGTSLTVQQAKLMKRTSSDIILCYDSDEPGRNATKRALDILGNEDMRVKVITVTGGKDPDEFIKANGAAAFRKLIDGSVNRIEYKLEEIKGRYSIEVPEEKVECLKEMVAVLAGIRNEIELEVYLKRVSEKMDISAESLKAEIKEYLRRRAVMRRYEENKKTVAEALRPSDELNPQRRAFPQAAAAEDAIITVLLNYPEYCGVIAENLSPGDFVTDFNRKIYQLLTEKIPANTTAEPIMLMSQEITADEMSRLSSMVKDSQAIIVDKQKVIMLCDRLKEEKTKATGNALKDMSEAEMSAMLERLREKHNK